MQFFLQNVQNEIFKIFRMFKSNMKFIRVACWINCKISNRDKTTTLTKYSYFVTIVGHYYCVIIESLQQSQTTTFQKNCFICFNESPLKMMESAFYFIWTALLVLKIFKFLYWFFGLVKKLGMIRKAGLISKSMTPQTG